MQQQRGALVALAAVLIALAGVNRPLLDNLAAQLLPEHAGDALSGRLRHAAAAVLQRVGAGGELELNVNTYYLHVAGGPGMEVLPPSLPHAAARLRVTVPLERLTPVMPVVSKTCGQRGALTHSVLESRTFLKNLAVLGQHVRDEMGPASGGELFPVPSIAMATASALTGAGAAGGNMTEIIRRAHASGRASLLAHPSPSSALVYTTGRPVAAVADVIDVRLVAGGGAVALTLELIAAPNLVPELTPHAPQTLDAHSHHHFFVPPGVSLDARRFLALVQESGPPEDLHLFLKGCVGSTVQCLDMAWAKPLAVAPAAAGDDVSVALTAQLDPQYSVCEAASFTWSSQCDSPASGSFTSDTYNASSTGKFNVELTVDGSKPGLAYPSKGRPRLCYLAAEQQEVNPGTYVLTPLFLAPPGVLVAKPDFCASMANYTDSKAKALQVELQTAAPTTLRCPGKGAIMKVTGASAFRATVGCPAKRTKENPALVLAKGPVIVDGVKTSVYSGTAPANCTLDVTKRVAELCDKKKLCLVSSSSVSTTNLNACAGTPNITATDMIVATFTCAAPIVPDSCVAQTWAGPDAVSAAAPGRVVPVLLTATVSPEPYCRDLAQLRWASDCESAASGSYTSPVIRPAETGGSVLLSLDVHSSTPPGLAYPASGRPLLCYLRAQLAVPGNKSLVFSDEASAPLYLAPPGVKVARPEFCAASFSGFSPPASTHLSCINGGTIRLSGATAFRASVACNAAAKLPAYVAPSSPPARCAIDVTAQVAALCEGKASCLLEPGSVNTDAINSCAAATSTSIDSVVTAYSCSDTPLPPCSDSLPPAASEAPYTRLCTGCVYNCTAGLLSCSACACSCRTTHGALAADADAPQAIAASTAVPTSAGESDALPSRAGRSRKNLCYCEGVPPLKYRRCRPGSRVTFNRASQTLTCV